MYSYIDCSKLVVDSDTKEKLMRLYEKHMRHEFDLLGSGFVKVDYDLQAKGMCGRRYANQYMAQYGKKIERRLKKGKKCSENYKPINWLVDFKSGFFFHPKKYDTREHCRDVIAKKRGVDIKCPWELGRCYHLTRLAICAVAEKSCRENAIIEFKDEVADFIETNPMEKTVQWSAPMDASIRTVNMLLAYDMLKQLDDKGRLDCDFDRKFEKLIRNSLEYVMAHLECYGKARAGGNHYLSNIAGVIFAAAYLPADDYTDACLAFGVQEMISQVERQFYPDGGHYEGSTSYHRLSAEFAIFATALTYGVLAGGRKNAFKEYRRSALKGCGLKSCGNQKYNPDTKEFFPRGYIDRLYNMGMLTRAVLKPNNEIVQIGENDNGRLVMLTPVGSGIEENVLDHRTLLAEIGAVFERCEWEGAAEGMALEKSFVQSLANGTKAYGTAYQETAIPRGNADIGEGYAYKKKTVIYREKEMGKKLNAGMQAHCFGNFGIVVLRGDRVFISMVIDTAKNKMFYGHTHNDKLSIEVMADGKYITRDPGSYTYTASPELLEKFCSVRAHNTIHVEGCEQNLMMGMWQMKLRVRAELVCAEPDRIIGRACYGDVDHVREVIVTDSEIAVVDYANCPFTVGFRNKQYASQYGKLEKLRTEEVQDDC